MTAIAIDKTDTINASADRIWEILSDEFADVSKWASAVDHSEARDQPDGQDGATSPGRTCEVPGFGFTDERFTNHDAADKTFSFSIDAEKIPGFFKNMESTWKVVSTGPSSSRVTTKIAGDATGVMGALVRPMMKRKFSSLLDQGYEDLKVYAETGQVSDAKRKAQAKHASKAAA